MCGILKAFQITYLSPTQTAKAKAFGRPNIIKYVLERLQCNEPGLSQFLATYMNIVKLNRASPKLELHQINLVLHKTRAIID